MPSVHFTDLVDLLILFYILTLSIFQVQTWFRVICSLMVCVLSMRSLHTKLHHSTVDSFNSFIGHERFQVFFCNWEPKQMTFESRTETASEHFAFQDSGPSQIFKLTIFASEKILNNINTVLWRKVNWEISSLPAAPVAKNVACLSYPTTRVSHEGGLYQEIDRPAKPAHRNQTKIYYEKKTFLEFF